MISVFHDFRYGETTSPYFINQALPCLVMRLTFEQKVGYRFRHLYVVRVFVFVAF